MKLQIFHCKSDTYQKKYKNKYPKKTESTLNYKYPYKKNIKINYHDKWNPINNNSQRYNPTSIHPRPWRGHGILASFR